MKKRMRIIVCLLAAALCLSLFAACIEQEQLPEPQQPSPDISSESGNAVSVTSAQGFENYGFTEHVCKESGYYEFAASGSDGITWSVYLLDEQFEDAARYLPQAYAPSLVGDGILAIDSGKHIYIGCSNTPMSDEAPVEDAMLIFYPVPEGQIKYAVRSEDSFENSGFTYWVCDAAGSYRIEAVGGAESVTWKTFVLDEEFADADRYIPQANECALEGSGTLELEAGQYVYAMCSANDFTGERTYGGAYIVMVDQNA